MNCRDLKEVLTAYADGEASPEEARRLEGHLRGCASCRASLKLERALKAGIAAAGAPAMPADLKADLLRRARRSVPAPRPVFSWRWPAGLGLGAAFAAATALIFMRSMPEDAVPVEALLAAHRQYELTLPAAAREELSADLPQRLAEADDAR